MTAEYVCFCIMLTGCMLLCLHIVLTVCLNVSVGLLRQGSSTKLGLNKLNGWCLFQTDGDRMGPEIHFRERCNQCVCTSLTHTHTHWKELWPYIITSVGNQLQVPLLSLSQHDTSLSCTQAVTAAQLALMRLGMYRRRKGRFIMHV